jgi:DNA repair protein SbcC/Rad50
MILRKLQIKNIRSYEDQTIMFPEGSLLISGDVGSGKTTILLAIEYALFGLQPGQKGSALLRNNAELGEVTLEFEVDGREVVIERRIKRGKSVTNDYASISLDGKKFESSLTEVKERILRVLGYPPEYIKKNNILYRYTVYTPQEQMKRIILEEPEVRLDVLRHVFGIDKYKQIKENLTILINRLKEEIRFMQSELLSLEKDRESGRNIQESLERLNGCIAKKESEILGVKLRKETIEKSISELEDQIKEKGRLSAEVDKASIMILSKRESLSSSIREINDLNSMIKETKDLFKEEALGEVMRDFEIKRTSIEHLNNLTISLAGTIKSLEISKREEISKKERVFSIKFCPTCLQDVPPAHKHNILNETEGKISEINKNLEKLGEEHDSIKDLLLKEKNDLNLLEEKKTLLLSLKSKSEYAEKSYKKLTDLVKIKESLEKDISLLDKHSESLKEQILSYTRFEAQYRERKLDLQKINNEEKAHEISIAELKKEVEINQKEYLKIQEQISNKNKLQDKLNNHLEVSDWLSNQFSSLIEFTERNVLIKLRKEFSALFKSWFLILAGEGFDLQLDESFTPVILQGDIEMDYSFLSGGERTAVALAYRLALNQTINSVLSGIKTKDIIILDEPTEGFSEFQIEKIRDILEQLNMKQLLIVSHEQKIEGFVNTVTKVRKISNVSYILEPESQNHKT